MFQGPQGVLNIRIIVSRDGSDNPNCLVVNDPSDRTPARDNRQRRVNRLRAYEIDSAHAADLLIDRNRKGI